MAVRTKLRHDENTKAKIKASQLVNFLQNHVLTGSDVKKTQITAAVALLKKVMPDLASVEGNLNHTYHHEDVLDQLEASAAIETHDAAYH